MQATFAQIGGAVECSNPNINVGITGQGRITGRSIQSTEQSIAMGSGNVDRIIQSFSGQGVGGGAIEGGLAVRSGAVISWAGGQADVLAGKIEKKGLKVRSVLERVKEVIEKAKEGDLVEDLKLQVEKLEETFEKLMKAKETHKKVGQGIISAGEAVQYMAGRTDNNAQAAMASLAMSSVNRIGGAAKELKEIYEEWKNLKKGITRILKEHMEKDTTPQQVKKLIEEYFDEGKASAEAYKMEGGAPQTEPLVERLTSQREQLRSVVNKFIAAFGADFGRIVGAMDKMAEQLGKRIDYDDKTLVFFDTFTRMKEFVDSNERNAKLHQYLLELNQNMQVDSKEVKERFISLVRDLSERADALDATADTKQFAKDCRQLIADINKYNDEIRNLFETMRKGGEPSNDNMNELFSIDSSRINISGMLNALEKMKIAVSKVWFYRNIAVFRSNLNQTNKEIATYSKDYTKSVGKAIGSAITKIQNEYTEVVSNINDNKAGMGLEIDMYNESRPADQKISKEKLKMIYKWQCDARIGLYKTVEAIDLYLLHFTETVTQNPDAVADLQKLLTATRIVAKWYDERAGDNIVRVFESLATTATGVQVEDGVVDAADFVATKYNSAEAKAAEELSHRIGGDRANKLYERCRRAIEGVVVLKNIISYFITISEKYGSFKGEKNIYMAPNNIYKNLVNYIWVSALDMNTMGVDVLTDNNELKRVITYKDTEVGIAQITPVDPELLGINFNRHSIDKLRLLKCHADLQHLGQFLPSIDQDQIPRLTQFITMLFGRLGKTKYIFQMFKFGVVDLTVMDKTMLQEFVDWVSRYIVESNMQIAAVNANRTAATRLGDALVVRFSIGTRNIDLVAASSAADKTALVEALATIDPRDRDSIKIGVSTTNALQFNAGRVVSLTQFKTFADKMTGFDELMVIKALNTAPVAFNETMRTGFVKGLLSGFLDVNDTADSVTRAKRILVALNYLLVKMIDDHRREYSSSVFAIDDTYFILTLKAIAGKVMAVTGISSIFKNPSALHNSITQSPTRMIMGGADAPEIIDDAVELYVRLPLLVEFYRRVFDNGNKAFRDLSETSNLDNEQISLVPEVGNVWSGLLINIFDKSKHIDSGLYTHENMQKIIGEINSIFKHFKGSVENDQLVRHVVSELVAEINRRYGVIKRQELLNYYRVVNATSNQSLEIEESNYSNNDMDILNEALEFQEKSPSDEYVKELKKTIEDKSVSTETKINKLTDYKIVKDFRERISSALTEVSSRGHEGTQLLTIRDRIRFLKRAIASKTSRDEKYDMIIKAIEEADAINQSANDIFMCFHEFVLVPLRTLSQMHNALRLFILTVNVLVGSADRNNTIRTSADAKELIRKMLPSILENQDMLLSGGELNMVPANIISGVVSTAGNAVSFLDLDNAKVKLFAAMVHVINAMSANAGDLVKVQVSTTKNITIDLSEYQKVCEHLVANVKYMIDKFTGLVPTSLLDKVSSRTVPDSIYNIEESLMLKIFNKQNKSESSRDVLCIDNLYRILPDVSKILTTDVQPVPLIQAIVVQPSTAITGVKEEQAMPFLRDTFTQYKKAAGMYVQPETHTYISTLLFDPRATSTFEKQPRGVIQEFNVIVSRYLNDLYDSQSKKIYSKAFMTFASNSLVDALNGQSIKDFHTTNSAEAAGMFTYHAPGTQTVLSATLAYAMKVLMTRIHPVTSVKIHDVASVQEVSPHMLEKYRMLIPMYLRICNAYVKRCKLLRKLVNYITFDAAGNVAGMEVSAAMTSVVKENMDDAANDFASIYKSLNGESSETARELIPLYLDELVNAMTALIGDMNAVQKELLETDSTVTLYFDLKKDFTKNFVDSNKTLPFAPLSILTMGFPNISHKNVVPLYTSSNITSSKFLYGLRTMLVDDFKLSSAKVPYLKKLLADFNGYSTSGNVIADAKFNDVLSYVGRAANFVYDARFYNGIAVAQNDPLSKCYPNINSITTFQESHSDISSLTIVESGSIIDSSNKISSHVKKDVVRDVATLTADVDAANANPRARVIMVNILDLNIMPLNVHSLMREVPLTNIYNYAMTFDEIVNQLKTDVHFPTFVAKLLKQPYTRVEVRDGSMVLPTADGPVNLDAEIPASGLRFIDDILYKKLGNKAAPGRTLSAKAMAARYNTKLVRNVLFMSCVQLAIKKKVKRELEFINTRVVANTSAVSDAITNASTDMGDVNENMFEF